jgi:hypothetical protein
LNSFQSFQDFSLSDMAVIIHSARQAATRCPAGTKSAGALPTAGAIHIVSHKCNLPAEPVEVASDSPKRFSCDLLAYL